MGYYCVHGNKASGIEFFLITYLGGCATFCGFFFFFFFSEGDESPIVNVLRNL